MGEGEFVKQKWFGLGKEKWYKGVGWFGIFAISLVLRHVHKGELMNYCKKQFDRVILRKKVNLLTEEPLIPLQADTRGILYFGRGPK